MDKISTELKLISYNLEQLSVRVKRLSSLHDQSIHTNQKIEKKTKTELERQLSENKISPTEKKPKTEYNRFYSESSKNIEHPKIVSKRILLNLRGYIFDIPLSVLDKAHEKTRLAALKYYIDKYNLFSKDGSAPFAINANKLLEICDDYDLEKREFYFNRDPLVLNLILTGLVTGKYNLYNTSVCVNLLTEELVYWKISRPMIESCCLIGIDNIQEQIDDEISHQQMILDELNFKEDFGKYCHPKLRETLFNLMENPLESNLGRAHLIFCLFIVILSTLQIVLESIPDLQNPTSFTVFFIIEIVCVAWFTLQLVVRFLLTTHKLRFCMNIMNIFILLGTIPFYLYLISPNNQVIIKINYASRAFRIFSLWIIIGLISTVKTLSDTIKYSYKEIIVYVVYLGISVLIFSCFVYYAEKDNSNSLFTSIPATFWWAVITMTTVGYGDMFPSSIFGKIVGGLCAISGIIIIAMPVGLLSNNFQIIYSDIKKKKILMERLKNVKGQKLTIQSQEDDI